MANLRLAYIYLGIGMLSGVISAVLTELKPLGLLMPGPVFGVSFVIASQTVGRHLRWPLLFICLASFAFVASDFAALMSLGFVDDIVGGRALCGGLCGLVGATVLGFYSIIEDEFDAVFFVVILAAGCVLGAAALPIEVYLNDTGFMTGPIKFMPLFVPWQGGMLFVLGLCRSRHSVHNFEQASQIM